MSMGSPRRSPPTCQYTTCTSTFALLCYMKLQRSMAGNAGTIEEIEPVDTWLCPADERTVRDALAKKAIVRRSVEGWVWVDVTPWILYG